MYIHIFYNYVYLNTVFHDQSKFASKHIPNYEVNSGNIAVIDLC